MRGVLSSLLICLMLAAAACGGGNDGNTGAKEEAYIPDLSTPEGTTEAFARGIETSNVSLLSLTLLDEERDQILADYSDKFEESRKQGVKWKIEVVDNDLVPGKEARALFKYIGTKDGKEESVQGAWAVFVKTSDGSWKYSRAASLAFSAAQKKLQDEANKPPANEEAPDNSETDG